MRWKNVPCLLALVVLLAQPSDLRANQSRSPLIPLPLEQVMRQYEYPSAEEAARLAPELSKLRAVHGDAWRVVRWNETLRTPASIAGPAIRLVAHDATDDEVRKAVYEFVTDNAEMLRAEPDQMMITDLIRIDPDRVHVIFGQFVDGLEVVFGRIDLSLWNGSVVMLGSEFYRDVTYDRSTPVDAGTAARLALAGLEAHESKTTIGAPRLVILPLEKNGSREYHLAWRVDTSTNTPSNHWRSFIDAGDGSILWLEGGNDRFHLGGDVWATVDENFGEPAQVPLDDARLVAAATYEGYTNETGDYSIEVPENTGYEVVSTLSGLYCEVDRYDAAPAAITGFGAPGDAIDFWYDDANSHLAERTMYYHINVIHDWIKENDPTFTHLDYPVQVQVNAPFDCNAYWNGGSLVFGGDGSGCNNPALISDLIYHEYGHAITDGIYAPYAPPTASGMAEAFSDIYAICIHPDPLIGENFWVNGDALRDGENLRQYPGTECGGAIHCLAEILMGAMWKARKNFGEKYGPDAASIYDPLHLNTVKTKQYTMPAYLMSLLVNNDDDGDLTNGTPDWDEICGAFAIHNLPCPELGSDVADETTSERFALRQNHPNPFSPATTIRYELAGQSQVRLQIFDVSGRHVRTLADNQIEDAGTHVVHWDGTDDQGRSVGNGVYFYRLSAGAHHEARCMVLVR